MLENTKNGLKDLINEDNTFKILKRIPFNDMCQIYDGAGAQAKLGISREEFFNKHGWTWTDYVEEKWNIILNFRSGI